MKKAIKTCILILIFCYFVSNDAIHDFYHEDLIGENPIKYAFDGFDLGLDDIFNNDDQISSNQQDDTHQDDEENKEDVKEVMEHMEEDDFSQYAYQFLSKDQQEAYMSIYEGITQFEKNIKIDTSHKDDIGYIFSCIIYDHPELIQVKNHYSYTDYGSSLVIEPNYLYDEKTTKKHMKKIEDITSPWIKEAKQIEDPYQRMTYLYTTLQEYTSYDESLTGKKTNFNGESGQTMVSALIDKGTVCTGYAQTYQYLCKQSDIPCTTVTGTLQGGSHAWNMVLFEDNTYYIDSTESIEDDDTAIDKLRVEDLPSILKLMTFSMNKTQAKQLHYKADYSFYEINGDDLKMDIFYRNDCYFDTYDQVKIHQMIENSLNSDPFFCVFKAKDENLAEEINDYIYKELYIHKINMKYYYYKDYHIYFYLEN